MYIAADCVYFGAYQFDGTCFDCFRPLGGVTHYQHRLTERRCLFLNTTGISKDQIGTIHQVDKGQVVERFNQVDVVDTYQQPINWLAHIGVEVHWVDDFYIRKDFGCINQGLADALEAIAKPEESEAAKADEKKEGSVVSLDAFRKKQ